MSAPQIDFEFGNPQKGAFVNVSDKPFVAVADEVPYSFTPVSEGYGYIHTGLADDMTALSARPRPGKDNAPDGSLKQLSRGHFDAEQCRKPSIHRFPVIARIRVENGKIVGKAEPLPNTMIAEISARLADVQDVAAKRSNRIDELESKLAELENKLAEREERILAMQKDLDSLLSAPATPKRGKAQD